MSASRGNTRRARARRAAVASGLAVSLAATSFAGVAGASGPKDDDHAHDETHDREREQARDQAPAVANLLLCISSKGVSPPGDAGVTNQWIDQVVAAARDCGFELPEALIAQARKQAAEAEARRQCLEAAGVVRPEAGQAPTPEAIAKFKAALVTCGIVPPGVQPASPQPQPKAEHGKAQRSKPSTSRRQRGKSTRTKAVTKRVRR